MDDARYHTRFTFGPPIVPIEPGKGSHQVRPKKCGGKPLPVNRMPVCDYEDSGNRQINSIVQTVEIKGSSGVECIEFIHNVTSFVLLCGIKPREKSHPGSS